MDLRTYVSTYLIYSIIQMYTCTYVRMYVQYAHACTYVYWTFVAYIHTYVCKCVHTHVCMYICMYDFMDTCTYVRTYSMHLRTGKCVDTYVQSTNTVKICTIDLCLVHRCFVHIGCDQFLHSVMKYTHLISCPSELRYHGLKSHVHTTHNIKPFTLR